MANYNNLKDAIKQVIKQNGNQEITGNVLQNTLLSMINSLGDGYQFMGVATPSTNPGTPDQKVFYIATQAGIYSNFSGLEIENNGLAILLYNNNSWTKKVVYYIEQESGISEQNMISQYGVTTLFNKAHAVAMFNYIKMTGKLPFTMGAYYKSDGSLVPSGNLYGYTPFIYLAPEIEYTIKASSTSNAKIVVYDKTGKTIIESFNTSDSQLILNSFEEERYVVISNNFVNVTDPKLIFDVQLTKKVDELIKLSTQEIDFLQISEPSYSKITAATKVNSLIENIFDKTGKQPIIETKEGYYIASNTIGEELNLESASGWSTELIEVGNNDVFKVSNINIPVSGKVVYLLLDKNNKVLKKQEKEDIITSTAIPLIYIYPGSAHKVAVCHTTTSGFTVIPTTTALAKEVVGLDNIKDEMISLFNTSNVSIPIHNINWEVGFYANNVGGIENLSNWQHCKMPKSSNGAYRINVNHINVAATGKIAILFWNNDNVISSIETETSSEDYSFSTRIPYNCTHWSINRRINNDTITVSIDEIIKNGDRSDIQEITVENSDKIAIIGDSYTESHFTVKGKAYINKMSLFSDYVFMNFAKSGDVYNGRLYDIRQNTPIYGDVPFAKYRPKFTMMCCYTNDIKVMNTNQFLECLQNIINVTKGLGTEPIVCTEYHTRYSQDSRTGVRSGLEEIARKNGLMFWDIASYVDLIRGSQDYAPFWGGSHPGSRANAIQSDNYEKYLLGLERPAKSIKLFRPRNTDISDLDNLMFNTNYERAKLFKEIFVGHSALNNSELVDNCTNAANSRVLSEYQKLIKKTPVSFTNACLISAVLPVLADTLNYLVLNLKDYTGSIKVYIRNSMASPYPSNTKYTRFDYTNLITPPNIGDVYTASNDSNTKQFTVVGVVEGIGDGDAKGTIFCSPADTSTTAGGTLTKVSGSGDASIPYSYRAVGYLQGDLAKDTGGHWVEILQTESGIYPIPTDLISSSVYTDRVDFLVICENGDFTISDLSIKYNDGVSKGYHRSIIPFETNYINDNEELLPSNTFGTVGEIDQNWNVTPTDIYEHQKGINTYPIGCSSKVDVTDTVSLKCIIPTSKIKNGSRKAILEIWCRYFPPIYSNGADDQITENSFDYNEIKVDIGVSSESISTLSERVNTHWKIVRFPIKLVKVGTSEGTIVKIYSNTKGIEVVYISLKYE